MGDSVSKIVRRQDALTGRRERLKVAVKHHVNGNRTVEPFPEGTQMALFGMGCFWGAERKFWNLTGVYSTQVGFAGGYTSNPTYKEVCSGAFSVSFKRKLAMQKLSELCTSQNTSVLRICSRSSGRIMTRHKECVKVMTLAPGTVLLSSRPLQNRQKQLSSPKRHTSRSLQKVAMAQSPLRSKRAKSSFMLKITTSNTSARIPMATVVWEAQEFPVPLG
ncbi:mitochondrial peptide methionine sulfoxide reductase isoform X1 [Notamacropus eugenii]|uniref:mitochondrial peptide methionine sulfoxide reductase isoform X1 n=1 Tax=Notamacropus eugenii TaxID=9315 RepID=UPI003B67664F